MEVEDLGIDGPNTEVPFNSKPGTLVRRSGSALAPGPARDAFCLRGTARSATRKLDELIEPRYPSFPWSQNSLRFTQRLESCLTFAPPLNCAVSIWPDRKSF